MLFAGILTFWGPKRFSLIVFYNGPCNLLRH
jgi:hypothetical protein